MWTILERIMAVIGFIATIVGTVIAYRTFMDPGKLAEDVASIAARLSREPSLDQQERLYVGQVMNMGDRYLVYIEKLPTSASGSFDLKLCDAKTGATIGEGTYAFGREGADFTPQFKQAGPAITIVLNAKLAQTTFSRKEQWRNANGNWSRIAEPKIVAGTAQSCL
ncbi:hypothetical protein [Aquabacter sediminis]|uniref:hypothetical protein n=1 Tax=Aquabacter sediminis TaxID=3029197 RepID=UPI00237DFE46|nr:hypothetical protein [Aquabacter sp. P-9]MDE1568475.1 hypothetical protein [Aquabacter sp. P-9]